LALRACPNSAAQDGNFFPVFGKVHPTKHFPHVSLLVLAGLACFFSISLKLKQAIAGILAMRAACAVHRPGGRSDIAAAGRGTQGLPFKMWLYPLPAVLTMIGWAWLFWQTGADTEMGTGGDRSGSPCVSHSRAGRCDNGRLKRKVISYLFSSIHNGSR